MLAAFVPEHVARMRLTEEARSGMDEESLDKLAALAKAGMCETVLTDDGATVLGVVAAVPTLTDTCEVLILSTEDQKWHPVVFVKSVRAALSIIRRHFGIITAIGEDTPFYARWFSFLGFACEGSIVRPEFGGTRMMMWEMRA